MQWVKFRPLLISIVTFCVVIGAAIAVIAYGRGYRVDITQKALNSTGLLVATSDPTGAQLLVNGKVTTATNATINLKPDWYTITVVKEGYQPWEKKLRVQGEVVTRADAFLFPTNPSLTALTASGVANPVLSPDGTKLAYVVPDNPKATNGATSPTGVWILDLVDKPLGLNRDAKQLAKTGLVDWSDATLTWSPDSKQVLACIATPSPCYLLEADRTNDIPKPIGSLQTQLAGWGDLTKTREKEKLTNLKEDFVNVATSSMQIVAFSPDETKVLYEATASATIPQIITPALIGTNPTQETRQITPGNLYIYDVKEDKNYLLGQTSKLGMARPTPTPTLTKLRAPVAPAVASTTPPLQWLPTSRHLLIVGSGKIEIMEYDGTNRTTVYAGPFWDGFAVPWTSGNKLIIATNLNASASAVNNVYAVNLH